jgi:hypothetical protein
MGPMGAADLKLRLAGLAGGFRVPWDGTDADRGHDASERPWLGQGALGPLNPRSEGLAR